MYSFFPFFHPEATSHIQAGLLCFCRSELCRKLFLSIRPVGHQQYLQKNALFRGQVLLKLFQGLHLQAAFLLVITTWVHLNCNMWYIKTSWLIIAIINFKNSKKNLFYT